MGKPLRVPLVYEYDARYGNLTDCFIDPTPQRKPLMARPSTKFTLDIGVPAGLIATYPTLTIDAELAFSVNFSNPGAALFEQSSQSCIAYVFHGIAPSGNADYYVGLYNITAGDNEAAGHYYLGSSVAAANVPFFTGAQLATACNPLNKISFVGLGLGGTGYVVNEQITLAGGTPAQNPIVIKVLTVDGSGTILTFSVLSSGLYGTKPANPVAQASTTGIGTGATFNITWTQVYGVVMQWALPSVNYAFVGVDTSNSAFVFSVLTDLPTPMVASVTDLSNYNFFLSTDGFVWNTDAGDPTTVEGLSFTQAFSKAATTPVTLNTHQGYLIAMGGDQIRFFYVTGAIDGSSVAPILNVAYGIGAMSEPTVANACENLAFLGMPDSTGIPVYLFQPNSQVPKLISYPYLSRILKQATIVTANFITWRGHIALCVNTTTQAWVFDIETKLWMLWNPQIIKSSVTALTNSSVFNNNTYIVAYDDSSKHFFMLALSSAGQDIKYPAVASTYVPTVNTPPMDFETMEDKQGYLACLVGDQTPTTQVCKITYSDDTGLTFATPLRTVDMATTYPVTKDLGRSRRRVWQIQFPADDVMRLDSLELAVNKDPSQQ